MAFDLYKLIMKLKKDEKVKVEVEIDYPEQRQLVMAYMKSNKIKNAAERITFKETYA